jgi:nucleoside-diphosphate kinase
VAGLERILVVLKPDAVALGFVGRLIQRFEDAGLKIVSTKMMHTDAEFAREHYFDLEERHGAGFYTRFGCQSGQRRKFPPVQELFLSIKI